VSVTGKKFFEIFCQQFKTKLDLRDVLIIGLQLINQLSFLNFYGIDLNSNVSLGSTSFSFEQQTTYFCDLSKTTKVTVAQDFPNNKL
jgi:hypothetical protein